MEARPPQRLYLGIAAAAGAVLALEIGLTRLFSYAIWYHFAYLTISVALLGYGAAGSVLAAHPALGRPRALAWWAVAAELGVLVALFQSPATDDVRHLVGIEEPEVALHPAAAGVLTDSLSDASEHAQILVTSHSPDLLPGIPDEAIFAVTAEHGETRVGPLDEAGRSALRDRLYTAGELLRIDQLRPDPALSAVDPDQLQLFGPEA